MGETIIVRRIKNHLLHVATLTCVCVYIYIYVFMLRDAQGKKVDNNCYCLYKLYKVVPHSWLCLVKVDDLLERLW